MTGRRQDNSQRETRRHQTQDDDTGGHEDRRRNVGWWRCGGGLGLVILTFRRRSRTFGKGAHNFNRHRGTSVAFRIVVVMIVEHATAFVQDVTRRIGCCSASHGD